MKTPDELLAKIMHCLAERYKTQLILKGGMLLRLLNSPRATQDLDYVWVRTKKRNLFGEELKEVLEEMEGIRVTRLQANSRGIFLSVEDVPAKQKAQIEITVVRSLHTPPQPMTTARLAQPFALQTHVIATMDLAEAFAHKIAAALERDLVRDLYDLMQLEHLTPIDIKTLQERLARLEVKRAKPKAVTLHEAVEMLRKKTGALTDKRIQEELGATLPPEELPGLKTILQASVERVLQKMLV